MKVRIQSLERGAAAAVVIKSKSTGATLLAIEPGQWADFDVTEDTILGNLPAVSQPADTYPVADAPSAVHE